MPKSFDDKPRRSEPRPEDLSHAVTSGRVGDLLLFDSGSFDIIRKKTLEQPKSMRLLALGAGSAGAEIRLARELGFLNENVTLIDKKFPEGVTDELTQQGFDWQEQEFLDFFAKAHHGQYDLVVGFGLEYDLRDSGELGFLLQEINKVLKLGGIVTIFPDVAFMKQFCERYGFKKDEGSVYSYIKVRDYQES